MEPITFKLSAKPRRTVLPSPIGELVYAHIFVFKSTHSALMYIVIYVIDDIAPLYFCNKNKMFTIELEGLFGDRRLEKRG